MDAKVTEPAEDEPTEDVPAEDVDDLTFCTRLIRGDIIDLSETLLERLDAIREDVADLQSRVRIIKKIVLFFSLIFISWAVHKMFA